MTLDDERSMTLDDGTLAFIGSCRRAVLATIRPDGRPRLVPVCFAVAGDPVSLVVYTPLDEKPKRSRDVRSLARVRDIADRPAVALLFDRWREDWSELAWVRLDGIATLLEPSAAPSPTEDSPIGEHGAAVILLGERYPQYGEQRLDRAPIIRVEVTGHRRWGAPAARRADLGEAPGRT